MNKKANIELKNFYNKIGRKFLFLGVILSVFIILVLIPSIIALILQITKGSGSLITFYQNMFAGEEYGISFILIQVFFTIVAIWFIGPVLAQQIIIKKKNYFWTTVFIIILIWMLLFFSSTITSGIQKSINFGINEINSVISNWFVFGFFQFLIMGIFHGLLIGHFIGKKIKSDGKKYVDEFYEE